MTAPDPRCYTREYEPHPDGGVRWLCSCGSVGNRVPSRTAARRDWHLHRHGNRPAPHRPTQAQVIAGCRAAYAEGQAARATGEPLKANPYRDEHSRLGKAQSAAWSQGWWA